ncbi:putative LRR receptor-like serine/threonine-protein kinase [Canna indica]|uniref:non-specific serine/threonine protein kinase n=1 Tax=Canna indica TaxID=4628 RepID=A0AAQ3JMB7_9LILI|nr:putative LRR receptor-like serine/threonine-protein kinase [Canna indica]
MISRSRICSLLLSSLLFLLFELVLGLNQDGALLLQFKYSVISDPIAALVDWNYDDATPCSWNGVMCMGFSDAANLNWTAVGSSLHPLSASRVTGLVLPNSQLVGSIPPELGLIEHLRHVELSGNALNGSLPQSIFNASELRVLSLANNDISGELPEVVYGRINGLQVLNLSDNALVGAVPRGLALLPNLTAVALANNYLTGEIPSRGFDQLEYLDMSSNLINGSLPADLGGQRLQYLNLSRNQITGVIPPELASRIPANATLDISFNNFTGEIPQTGAFASQNPTAFAGNSELCGKPLESLCTIPSTLSNPPNSTTETPSESPPAFAAMPKAAADGTSTSSGRQGGLRPAVIMAIAVGDAVGIAFLCAVFYYVYRVKKKNRVQQQQQHQQLVKGIGPIGITKELAPAAPESKRFGALACLRRKDDEEEDSEETSASSDLEAEEEGVHNRAEDGGRRTPQQQKQQVATLVTVDGDTVLELETLLKASAYILGATGSSIVYKAVLVDGTALAVRRIGESSGIDKLKDFDALVRSIAKLRHPNLLRLRGFYWGADEKLLIHDFAPNGSLANISFTKKPGSSPFHLSWESRLRIARGVARGLAYLHEKKSVHGNLKPSNILLDVDMEPKIADFGLDRLMSGDGGYRLGTSSRLFGSKRSVQSQSSLPDLSPPVAGASPCGSSSASILASPAIYQAPEFLKNLKPNAKWDVYSFGMVLLELLAGRALSEVELGDWGGGFVVVEERNRILRMADPAVRGEVEGKEEALLSCFKLGFACCAAAPQKRPAMKEAVQVLEKTAASSSSSSSFT